MKESLIDALRMALFKRKISANLLLHSDRGSQYASENFQQLLASNNIKCSMSRSGNCWDNAAMESFFHSLKTECVYHEKYLTREQATTSIFDYIEVFYNRQRNILSSATNHQKIMKYLRKYLEISVYKNRGRSILLVGRSKKIPY